MEDPSEQNQKTIIKGFHIKFRHFDEDATFLCEQCENKPTRWYNETLCEGVCEDCMRQIEEEYARWNGA